MKVPRITPLLWALALPLIAQEEAKPYRLFVGVDLNVTREEAKIPVEALRRHEVVVAPAHGDRIPLRDVPHFGWTRTTKISRAPVTISNFQRHATYSLRNDKAMKWMQSQNQMAVYQQEKADVARLANSDAQRHQAVRRQIYAYQEETYRIWREWEQNVDPSLPDYQPGGRDGMSFSDIDPAAGEVEALLVAANETAAAVATDLDRTYVETSGVNGDPFFEERTQDALGQGDEDVLELTFEIASREPIADAYLVVMGNVMQAGQEGIVTFHQNVGAIGPKPRKIKVRKTGFAPGFTISDVNLHLYTHGQEIATNRSERNVALTRDQAREFLLLSHIAEHPLDTITPQPVWTLAPAVLLAAKSGASYDHPVVATIDSDGSVISIHQTEEIAQAFLAELVDAAKVRRKATPVKTPSTFADAVRVRDADDETAFDQTGQLPPQVVAAMREMIFLPALELGVPIVGTAKVNLVDFFK
ncbi:hypothetical protein [Synoicihabitans lomoniglobus]|uniref:Uncharacterized protein n=1 Tax=Synoicihabitans lomoniglobus TaxID=2909285 RepID=A0AAE9ZYV6_9BACT|nr:hypothetical protein [Opitutaceae bacterium LMO-M01]WED65168.1 hypothetical protein PXH66_22755 [Opitutaceae bacterium LMO-M01]